MPFRCIHARSLAQIGPIASSQSRYEKYPFKLQVNKETNISVKELFYLSLFLNNNHTCYWIL